MKTPKILLVEDDEASLFGYTRYIEKAGYLTKAAMSLSEAKGLVLSEQFDAVLLDLKLPDGNAIDWIEELRGGRENMAIIVISGAGDVPTAVKAIKCGADNFLTKPINMEDLLLWLRKSLEIEELRKRDSNHQRLTQKNGAPFFGENAKMQEIINFATIAAKQDTVVLLNGETGTGKGVLARWIHDHSSRKNETFVELNCSALKGELLRSELFGHAKGAFTSAIKDRAGLIEVADGGTLFLDEIGDMDLDVQAQLLKTIEERSFRRIGENRVRSSDFRLICATNRDLEEVTRKGTFRNDLYYRICVFPIHIPPLRERKDDLVELSEYLLQSFAYSHFPLSQEVIDVIEEYPWPGNVRELRNMLERALLLAQGQPLSPRHFPGLEVFTPPPDEPETEEGPSATTIDMKNLEQIEKAHIIKTLKFYGGDKYEASKALGISLSSLYRKLGKIQGVKA